MTELSDLPSELVLKILSYLSIPDIHSTTLSSRTWHQFFLTHEHSVYHQAACYHCFVPSMHVLLQDAKASHPERVMREVYDWHDFCKRLIRLHTTWAGHGQISMRVYTSPRKQVHRIKVDEEAGILITSHSTSGIKVSDLDTDTLLWELDTSHVRAWAHVEYGNGFLIFDRYGEFKEVWRLATEYDAACLPTSCPPDSTMIRQGSYANKRSSSIDKRGQFKPWALLRSPEWGRAFRFVYPTLLVGSFSKAYLFDVESAQLIQSIENTQLIDGNALGEIHYVEVNTRHVFICGSAELRVFDRANGALLFRLSPNADHSPHLTQLRIVNTPPLAFPGPPELKPLSVALDNSSSRGFRYFVAVHVCGRDLVVLRDDGQFLFIRDYEEVIQKKKLMSDLAVDVIILDSHPLHPNRSVYMAFEHGRLAVVTTAGVFVFTLDPTYHNPDYRIPSISEPAGAENPTLPLAILSCKVLPLDNYFVLDQVTCLQMTESKLFLTYHPRHAPQIPSDEELKPHPQAHDFTDAGAGPTTDTMHDITDDQVFEVEDEDVNLALPPVPGQYPDDMMDDEEEYEVIHTADDGWYDEDHPGIDDGEDDGEGDGEDDGEDVDLEPDLRSVVCVDFNP